MSSTTATQPGEQYKSEHRLTLAYLLVAMVALFGGALTGLLQGLDNAGMDLYPRLAPVLQSYYQGLSVHGVLNALVWTTFFISGFLSFVTAHSLKTPLASRLLSWGAFWLMLAGLVLAAVPLLDDTATVLFTFYPPMQASWAFYVGLTLVVVATWLVTLNLALTYRGWRTGHPGERTPLAAFMSLVTFVMWTIASLGIAAEMLFMLIPWSLGWVQGTDALVARVLFWYTGHPIVYFWLLPAYVSWYTFVPRQAGGRLFSDPLARVSFILFLVLSTPLGFHHQFEDPGIAEGWKFVHMFITFAVFFPSLMTFFNVVASLESGGRARGGRGWVAWFFKLPWGDPSLACQLLAMLTFAFGGIGGLINASGDLNLVVHNTAWIVGHLHLTIGTAVTLTFMGISYWLVPVLCGKALWSRRLALAQGWLWAGGMLMFSYSLHSLGLLGMPRRTQISGITYMQPEWGAYLPFVAIGGTILFLSALLYFLNMGLTLTLSRQPAPAMPEFSESYSGPEEAPAILDRWPVWLALSAVLILFAYGPPLYRLLRTTPFNAPGFQVW